MVVFDLIVPPGDHTKPQTAQVQSPYNTTLRITIPAGVRTGTLVSVFAPDPSNASGKLYNQLINITVPPGFYTSAQPINISMPDGTVGKAMIPSGVKTGDVLTVNAIVTRDPGALATQTRYEITVPPGDHTKPQRVTVQLPNGDVVKVVIPIGSATGRAFLLPANVETDTADAPNTFSNQRAFSFNRDRSKLNAVEDADAADENPVLAREVVHATSGEVIMPEVMALAVDEEILVAEPAQDSYNNAAVVNAYVL